MVWIVTNPRESRASWDAIIGRCEGAARGGWGRLPASPMVVLAGQRLRFARTDTRLHSYKPPEASRRIGSSKDQPGCVMVIADLCDADTSIGVALRDGTTKHTAGPHYTPLVRGIARLGGGAGEHVLIRHPAESPRASHPSVLRRHWRARGTENDLSTIRLQAGPPNTTHLLPV